MKVKALILSALILMIFSSSFIIKKSSSTKEKVLVFSKTTGFRHENIEAGVAAIKKLGEENGFASEATEDAGMFTDAILKQYKALVFLNPTGDKHFYG